MNERVPVLGASPIHGVGVFTRFDIPKDTFIPLWEKDDCKRISKKEVKNLCGTQPHLQFFFDRYCLEMTDCYWCPVDFARMSVGWYLNHSDAPNVYSLDGNDFYALRDINTGEELTIDYQTLGEETDNQI